MRDGVIEQWVEEDRERDKMGYRVLKRTERGRDMGREVKSSRGRDSEDAPPALCFHASLFQKPMGNPFYQTGGHGSK